MKRFMTIASILAILAMASSASAQISFGWTISASSVDPFQNSSSTPFPGFGNVYLWLQCSTATPPNGAAAAEMDVAQVGLMVVGFAPMNGFLNAGGPKALLLAVGGCPNGPVVAGSFTVIGTVGNLCLVPSAANNWNITVDCNILGWNNDYIGFANDGSVPCASQTFCAPTAVEESSWGTIKSLYR